MPLLKDLIPDAESVVKMDVAELAGYMLRSLTRLPPPEVSHWNRRNYIGNAASEYTEPRQGGHPGVVAACEEAWHWLANVGLIIPRHDQHGDWYRASRAVLGTDPTTHVKAMIAAAELPEHFLHPEIALRARPHFMAGRFDTAVFEAYKTLEIRIREVAGFDDSVLGTKLAGLAFDKDDGPLTDPGAEESERVALRNLVAGALGSFKNPTSHRRVALSPADTRAMLIFASHLVSIVDSRRKADSTS